MLGMAGGGGAGPLREPPSTSAGGLPGGVVDLSVQSWLEHHVIAVQSVQSLIMRSEDPVHDGNKNQDMSD